MDQGAYQPFDQTAFEGCQYSTPGTGLQELLWALAVVKCFMPPAAPMTSQSSRRRRSSPEAVTRGRRQRSPPEVPAESTSAKHTHSTSRAGKGNNRSYRQADTFVCRRDAFNECNPSREGTDRNGYNRVPLNLRAAGGFLNCPATHKRLSK